jgi:hypothetical protein
MANNLITTSNNPFLRAADQLREKGKIDRKAILEETPIPTRSSRARLNFIPDGDTLMGMIDRAVSALSKGRIFDRGAILNLLV